MTRPLPEDHERMCAAVRQAGEAVRQRFEAGNTKAWEKDDDTPVSEADYESNDILKAALLDDEDYGWLSEESAEDEDRLSASRTWIVDPIDGTHAFLKGQPHFAVCVALVEDGRAVSAAIFNPATDEFFEAIRGGGARCNGEALCASSAEELDGCRVLGSKAMFEHPGWPEPWPVMRLAYRNSTSYRLALVAAGRYDATIALVRKADWDVAPGALIACEAGAVATDHKGDPFVFAKPHPVQRALVCAAPRLYPRIIERLGHLPDDLRQVAL